jgi:hypothetical protein
VSYAAVGAPNQAWPANSPATGSPRSHRQRRRALTKGRGASGARRAMRRNPCARVRAYEPQSLAAPTTSTREDPNATGMRGSLFECEGSTYGSTYFGRRVARRLLSTRHDGTTRHHRGRWPRGPLGGVLRAGERLSNDHHRAQPRARRRLYRVEPGAVYDRRLHSLAHGRRVSAALRRARHRSSGTAKDHGTVPDLSRRPRRPRGHDLTRSRGNGSRAS